MPSGCSLYASEKLESADGDFGSSSGATAVCMGDGRIDIGGVGSSRCVAVMLKIGSIWFRRTGMLDGSGGWSGRGESGDNGFVWNSGASGVMKALRSSQETWRYSGMGCSGGLMLDSSSPSSLEDEGGVQEAQMTEEGRMGWLDGERAAGVGSTMMSGGRCSRTLSSQRHPQSCKNSLGNFDAVYKRRMACA